MEIKDTHSFEQIIKKTLQAIESSKEEIFTIIHETENEINELQARIKKIKKETKEVIDQVDSLYRKDKLARKHLATVSKEIKKYDEEDIRNAYEKAADIRLEYMQAQQKEKELRRQRNELEQSLMKTKKVLESGERIMNQITVALSYLAKDKLDEAVGNKEDQVNTTIKMLKAQEKERRRISREIHDGPAQSMANIVFKTEICKKTFEKDIEKGYQTLNELKETVQKALKEVRQIIYDLRPMSLDDIGFLPTIRKFIKKFEENEKTKVEVTIGDQPKPLDEFIELAVYRIVQEIFTNISKHAKASNVVFKMSFGTKYMRVKIEDNGVGFNVERRLEEIKNIGEHYGLLGLLSRVKELIGSIEINSQVSKGTEVIVKIPISKEVMLDELTNE